MHREAIDFEGKLGVAIISPNEPVKCNTKHSWEIKYTAGKIGVSSGGVIRITIPHGFSRPQTDAFFEPGFVTLEPNCSDKNIKFHIEIAYDIFCRLDPARGHSGAWGRNIFIHILEGEMKEGDSISVIYGNADYYGNEPFGHAGAWSRELSGNADFIIAVDPSGEKKAPYSGFTRIKEIPSIKILPDEIYKIRAILKNNSKSNDCKIHILEYDKYNNPISAQFIVLPNFQNENSIWKEIKWKDKIITSAPDFSCIKKEIKSTFDGDSNHFSELDNLNLYWGDIHGHTIHSDGLGSYDNYFNFAKEISCLDFTAITDHDDIGPRLYDEEWELLKKKVEDYNSPGEFVTFLGHEYRNGQCDMNCYYPDISAPILRGTDGDLSNAGEFTRNVGSYNGMIIPHMHFGADWSGYVPWVYRLIEVFSSHGSAEYSGCPREIPYLRKQLQKSSDSNKDSHIQDALNRGFKLGFTAGSDTHSGRPGFSDWTRVCRTYLGGLTAVFAEKLTRDSIWDALYKRRCYATTGNRSILLFKINNAFMGEELKLIDTLYRNLSVKCWADGDLSEITIFKSGKIWKEEKINGTYVERNYEDLDKECSDWYYVRIMLEDGGMIWSSPIWVVGSL